MNRIDLNEKVAVITGGAQGIGLAIAERMLDSGASVSLWDRDQKLVDETVRSLETRGMAEAVVVDVTDLASVKSATEKTKTSMFLLVNTILYNYLAVTKMKSLFSVLDMT